jgi:2-hydroxychromene-2-carboxylate isomerase
VGGAVAFFFAPGCPISYLVAERAERALGEVEWVPILPLNATDGALLAAAQTEARRLRLPLELPDDPACDARPLTRAACLAAELGLGSEFGLAAARLIFCGGYAADDRRVIAEAAEVAGLSVDEALQAAGDPRHDAVLQATGRGLTGRGLRYSPVVRIGRRWFEGLQALPGAAILAAVREEQGNAPSQPAV